MKENATDLEGRLQHAQIIEIRVNAAWRIFNCIYGWYLSFKIHGIGLKEKAIGMRTFMLNSKAIKRHAKKRITGK
jgi:hypothetical protein